MNNVQNTMSLLIQNSNESFLYGLMEIIESNYGINNRKIEGLFLIIIVIIKKKLNLKNKVVNIKERTLRKFKIRKKANKLPLITKRIEVLIKYILKI